MTIRKNYRGTGWKKMKGLAKEYICITHGHRQQWGEGQREGGDGGWMERGKSRNWGHLQVSTNKIKKKRNDYN